MSSPLSDLCLSLKGEFQMSKLFAIACLIVLCAGASSAQTREYPKIDFTAGYTVNFSKLKGNIITGSTTLNGFTAAVGANVKKNWAIEGDLTYTTKRLGTAVPGFPGNRVDLFSYLGGPRFTFRQENKKLQPFVHGLFGGAHATVQAISENGFAAKFGGGLDIVASKHVAVRVFQGDYYLTRFSGQNSNNATLTFGVRLF
jgi:Outer membrane protein beta-barrel domain